MEKVTGIFYERGKSFNFGNAACIIAIIALTIMAIPSKTVSMHSNEIPDFTVLFIVSLLLIIPFSVISLFYFFTNITTVFVVDNGKLEINFYRGGSNMSTIPVESYKFSIISGKSNYNGHGSRVLIELKVNTINGSFAFTENLPPDQNPGILIRPENGWYVEKYFAREPGALLELYSIIKKQYPAMLESKTIEVIPDLSKVRYL